MPFPPALPPGPEPQPHDVRFAAWIASWPRGLRVRVAALLVELAREPLPATVSP